MADFTMPSLGADMDEGTLQEWLVKPGDTVHKGDVVAVVDTSKANIEVESFVEGVVQQLLVEPGTTVPVGQVLAVLGDDISAAPSPETSITTPAETEAPPVAPPVAPPAAPATAEVDATDAAAERPQSVRVTPLARRLAAELGVDLRTVTTADGAPIRAKDVRAAAAPSPAAPSPAPAAPVHEEPVHEEPVHEEPVHEEPVHEEPSPAQQPSKAEATRTVIAHLMSRSKQEIPHYYLSTTVDLARSLDWLHERNRALDVSQRLVPAALMLKATALAAQATPTMNGFWVDGGFRPGGPVHLGIAISLRGGALIAPALHNAADLPIEDLMAGMRDLVARARTGRLRGSELSDSTITVTNLGEQGVETVYGVIYPPQVAVVGFGRVVDRPWAVDGLIGVRPVTTLTLAGDHRATDGFTGARFLADIEQRLQHPEEL
ncbi:dihydrolipoamide acetyltransferase family protein [Nocardioides sp. NPDC006273]|uniref:dihydrolipoamide acetyltransferase family protein n=1 Tax=Nocardioides sp. NPDC006273 TaxID=3155598 RepID=UPI0033AABA9D